MDKSARRLLMAGGLLALACAPAQSPKHRQPDITELNENCVNGSFLACSDLADMYEKGRGVARNPERAAEIRKFEDRLLHRHRQREADTSAFAAEAEAQPKAKSPPDAPSNVQPEPTAEKKLASPTCEDWFDRAKAATLTSAGLKEPEDIRLMTNDSDGIAAGLSMRDGVPFSKLRDLGRKRIAEQYCKLHRGLVVVGKTHEAVTRVIKKFQAAQTITPAEARKLFPPGQAAVWQQLKAPSTAKLVSQDVVFRCAEGDVVASYTFDAQNSFGAMLRGQACAFIAADAGNATVIDCRIGDILRSALPKGDIDRVVYTCGMYHSLLQTKATKGPHATGTGKGKKP